MRAVFTIILLIWSNIVSAGAMETQIPTNVSVYGGQLVTELRNNWSNMPNPVVMFSLIEQESCVKLTSARCWGPTSRLYTKWDNGNAREEGAGLAQLTRAWKPNGRLRMDTLSDLARKYPELRELNWSNVYDRPDLQMRAMVILYKENYEKLKGVSDVTERLRFATSAYNGGLKDVYADMRLCGLSKGCDAAVWKGNVETHSQKSMKILYGGKSARVINREHNVHIHEKRLCKYADIFNNLKGKQ